MLYTWGLQPSFVESSEALVNIICLDFVSRGVMIDMRLRLLQIDMRLQLSFVNLGHRDVRAQLWKTLMSSLSLLLLTSGRF